MRQVELLDCPACGGINTKLNYENSNCWYTDYSCTIKTEHFRRNCLRCSYMWCTQDVLDTRA